MCPKQEMYSEWPAWIRRHSVALMAGLAIPLGLIRLWNAGCKGTLSALSAVYLGGIYLYCWRNARQEMNVRHLVVITGCDSGLGYSLALHCRALGAVVVAGLLEPESKNAEELTKSGVLIHRLNVIDEKSVAQFARFVTRKLRDDKLVLHTLVNNAGVMIFGEFEWQTDKQINRQVAVNLLGTMRITREMMPIIRENTSRIIVITSHCAMECLPGLSIYSATKIALHGWSTSLRVELAKYNIQVISFIPGSFVKESNIMAMQRQYFEVMERAMSEEAKRFYGQYFIRYADFFSSVANLQQGEPRPLANPKIYEIFDGALLDIYPSTTYKCEPWGYFFYFTFFKIVPVWMRDRLICRFMHIPSYRCG